MMSTKPTSLPIFSVKNQRGFTLIEFLVVMVILGIVGVMGALSWMPSMEKSRDGRRKADLANISKALEAYNTDRGRYPASNATGQIEGCGPVSSPTACTWGEAFVDSKGTVYMGRLPEDPRAFSYFYLFDSTVGGYALLARLENEQDPVRPMTTDTTPKRGVYTYGTTLNDTACGGSGCSYVQYGPTTRLALPVAED